VCVVLCTDEEFRPLAHILLQQHSRHRTRSHARLQITLTHSSGEDQGALFDGMNPVREYCRNPVYDFGGMEVTHWLFYRTNVRCVSFDVLRVCFIIRCA